MAIEGALQDVALADICQLLAMGPEDRMPQPHGPVQLRLRLLRGRPGHLFVGFEPT